MKAMTTINFSMWQDRSGVEKKKYQKKVSEPNNRTAKGSIELALNYAS
jgi:hypothetical protein